MKKENITIYSCEHCSKVSRYGGAIIAHEKSCKKNPANINACVGCKFLDSEIFYAPDKKSYGEKADLFKHIEFNIFSCSKLNQNMYPAKAKKRIKEYPESFEGKVQMPNTCKHYEVELIEENEI